MTASVLILPVISRYSFSDPDWREQYEREREAAATTANTADRRDAAGS